MPKLYCKLKYQCKKSIINNINVYINSKKITV